MACMAWPAATKGGTSSSSAAGVVGSMSSAAAVAVVRSAQADTAATLSSTVAPVGRAAGRATAAPRYACALLL